MIVGRMLGWLLVALAIVAFGWEIVALIDSGTWQITALGKLWFDIHSGSLGLAQVVVERYVWPPIWDPVILTLLQWPGWVVLGVPGLVLAWLFRRGVFIALARKQWRRGLAAGIMGIAAYWIVIWALSIGTMAQVAALRETSVVFAAVIGSLVLKESFGRFRIAAAALVAAGIVLLQV